MAKRKAFVLRIRPELLDAVEKWAIDEFRSTNGQLEWIISQELKKARRYPKRKETDKKTGSF
ncbi:MAG: hypothetical protein KAT48_02475 [Bacteroidales bacterium]|nr:hypothetical protein [Bacteroidales bacterium]